MCWLGFLVVVVVVVVGGGVIRVVLINVNVLGS